MYPKWLPEDKLNEDGDIMIPGGMYILWKLPEGMLEPVPLEPRSHIELQKVYYKVLMSWEDKPDMQTHVEEWRRFMEIAPKTDDVDQYLQEHPEQFHVPFKDTLFRGNNDSTTFYVSTS